MTCPIGKTTETSGCIVDSWNLINRARWDSGNQGCGYSSKLHETEIDTEYTKIFTY